MSRQQAYWAKIKAEQPEKYQKQLEANKEARLKYLGKYKSVWTKMKAEDPEKYQLCLAKQRIARQQKRSVKSGSCPHISTQPKKIVSRFSSDIRQLTNLSEGKFERALNKICRTW